MSLAWIARLAERFVISRDWRTLVGLDDCEVQAVLDVAGSWAPYRRCRGRVAIVLRRTARTPGAA